MSSLVSVSDAARELGVHPSRVRALISSGAIAGEKIGGVWAVDAASLAQRERERGPAGRPFAARNAWLILLAASGEELPRGVSAGERWRVRQALAVYGLEGLLPRLRGRGDAASYWALPGELRALRESGEIVLGGASAGGAHELNLVGSDMLDAYVPASRVESLVREHALERMPGPDANVILRAVPDDAWLLAGRRVAPLAVVAADLRAYPDPRAQRAGAEVIARLDAEGAGR